MSRKTVLIGLAVVAVLVAGAAGGFVFVRAPSSPAAATGHADIGLSSYDKTMGNPDAPVTIVEYASPSCPVCARWTAIVFPPFKAKYIDTGKVFYVYRVFPRGAVDVAAEAMARCLPENRYFRFVDTLFRDQPKWDPEYGVQDVHAGLVDVGSSAGMSQDQVDACIANKATQERISRVGTDATEKYGINATPSFVINGQVHAGGMRWEAMQQMLDPLVAGK